jgi:chitinase
VSAILSVTGGSASQGQDYTFPAPRTVTWVDGDGADKTVSIPITQDQLDESAETIQVTLTLPANPFGATRGAQVTTTVTITDDDPPASLSLVDAQVAEGNAGSKHLSVTVTLSPQSGVPVTVQYATQDGTATAGSDYAATSGTLSFQPGEISKTIAVQVLGDTSVEADETFTLTLSTPTNATLSTAQATGSIQNDDSACSPRPRVTQALATGGGALNVNIQPTPLNTSAGNTLQQIRFGSFQNATVTLNGQEVASGQAVTLPAGATSADLVVRRATAGQPTTVPLTVVDGCGDWQTFVGGGTGAGF